MQLINSFNIDPIHHVSVDSFNIYLKNLANSGLYQFYIHSFIIVDQLV